MFFCIGDYNNKQMSCKTTIICKNYYSQGYPFFV